MEKYAFITGSSRGIGRAIALQLAQDGFNIILHCRRGLDRAEEVLREIRAMGRIWMIVQSEITDYEGMSRVFDEIGEFTQHLDLLVNNVGFDYDKTLENYSITEIQSVIDTVLTSKLVVTKLALDLLKKAPLPQVINIASRIGKSSVIPWVLPYGAAEAGVIRFTELCVSEMTKKHHIRFNTIAPWITDTDYARLYTKDQSDWDAIAKRNPLGRTGLPQDIAKTISFLASEKSAYINGECIQVTGGSQFA